MRLSLSTCATNLALVNIHPASLYRLCTRFNLNLHFFLYATNWVSQCISTIVWSRPRVLMSQRDSWILSHNLGELPKTSSQWTSKHETYWFINVKVGNLIGIHFLLASRLMKKLCLLKHHIGQNMKQEVRLCAVWPGRTWISSKFSIAIEPSPHPWSASSRPSLIKAGCPCIKLNTSIGGGAPNIWCGHFYTLWKFPNCKPVICQCSMNKKRCSTYETHKAPCIYGNEVALNRVCEHPFYQMNARHCTEQAFWRSVSP